MTSTSKGGFWWRTARRGLALLAATLPVAVQASGHWVLEQMQVVKPTPAQLGQACTYKGNGGRNGNAGGGEFETKCYSPSIKVYDIRAGNMGWSYFTNFTPPPPGVFNVGLDLLQPGRLIGFSVQAAATRSRTTVSAAVTLTIAHPASSRLIVVATPYSTPDGQVTATGWGKVPDKPNRLLDGRVPQLWLTFELNGSHASQGIRMRNIYNWVEAGSAPPPPPPVPPTPTVTPPAPSQQQGATTSLGCYRDNVSQRDLAGYTYSKPGMTTPMCLATCRQQGYRYAATQFGSHCFCGNAYGRHGQADNCNMACSGDRSQTCGGHTANSVYDTGTVATAPQPAPPASARQAAAVGCYRDTVGSRDLHGYTFNTPAMTTGLCLSTCAQKGFRFAATQYATHCFCGNEYGKHGSASNCDMACGGDKGQICGGHSANSVYRTGR